VEEWITLVLLPVCAWLMRLARVPLSVRPVMAGVWLAYQQSGELIWSIAPVALVVLHFTGRLARKETSPLSLGNLAELVRCSLTFMACILIYSNLKAVIPILNPNLFDEQLLAADRALFFGHAPNELLPHLRAPWLVHLMDEAYSSFFLFFPATMGLSFFLNDRRALRTFVAGYVLCFYLGVAFYYLAPSWGTVFSHPEWYLGLPRTRSDLIRDTLMREYRKVLTDPAHFHAKAFLGIAAFPSLHIAHVTVAVVVAWRHFRWTLWVFLPVAIVMGISTMYFGWHYFMDLVGAMVVAWLAFLILEGRRRAPRPVEA
jgi:membrane-associated phospholipid phosphatase